MEHSETKDHRRDGLNPSVWQPVAWCALRTTYWKKICVRRTLGGTPHLEGNQRVAPATHADSGYEARSQQAYPNLLLKRHTRRTLTDVKVGLSYMKDMLNFEDLHSPPHRRSPSPCKKHVLRNIAKGKPLPARITLQTIAFTRTRSCPSLLLSPFLRVLRVLFRGSNLLAREQTTPMPARFPNIVSVRRRLAARRSHELLRLSASDHAAHRPLCRRGNPVRAQLQRAYPDHQRVLLHADRHGLLFHTGRRPAAQGRLRPEVQTLPEMLREKGYNTTCVGFTRQPRLAGLRQVPGLSRLGQLERGPQPESAEPQRCGDARTGRLVGEQDEASRSSCSCATWTPTRPTCRPRPTSACSTMATRPTRPTRSHGTRS